jgi:D-threo-aldose 1-dehydrogenase
MNKLTKKMKLGRTEMSIPPIVFGSSCLGNLYEELPYNTKLAIVREWVENVEYPVIDTAGKYGAGLALEMIGKSLRELNVPGSAVAISNKLGWKRIPLKGHEPTFESGAWANLKNDAEQRISGKGIIECYEQGCELIGPEYAPQIVSVHDPDEYLNAAKDQDDRKRRLDDVVEAYSALHVLKQQGRVNAIGVGSKDWTTIRELDSLVELDWIMFACSLTPYSHEPELIAFMKELNERGIGMINSAVFNAGFLVGGNFFDYRIPDAVMDAELFAWRDKFLSICEQFGVIPAEACIQFGMSVPGVSATALNTSKPANVIRNVKAISADIPGDFWRELKTQNIIDDNFPYLG